MEAQRGAATVSDAAADFNGEASRAELAEGVIVSACSGRGRVGVVRVVRPRLQRSVTDHPTTAWTAQQLRNAFPEDHTPRYVLHDRETAFMDVVSTIGAMQIHEVLTAQRSPWQNAYVERVIGSFRRECLDDVIVLSVAGLRRVL